MTELQLHTIELNLKDMKRELQKAYLECNSRGLLQTSKWLSEINFALKDVMVESYDYISSPNYNQKDNDLYMVAKSYFDLKEYDRCAFFSKSLCSDRIKFIHFYSRYLSGEKKKLYDVTDSVTLPDNQKIQHLKDLRQELQKLSDDEDLDGFCTYLYGVTLKKLGLNKMAIETLCDAIHKEPCHWGSWLELSSLIYDKDVLNKLDLPNHWVKHFFLAHTYLELQLNDEALTIYSALEEEGLQNSTYIMAQQAIAYHNMRQVEHAVDIFKQLSVCDPYRLDNLDTYSNLLYVRELHVNLAYLAHHTSQIDKYRTETCCVIGNYYSLRSQHEKAVLYFQRALKLNPNYLAAWTLMGHEYMEMKNTNAAIQSYRHALEVNRRDYRAWYGLGQTYEILKMYFYSLYYYKQAQQLKPTDSRMLVALGESYEKLDRIGDAMKCFWKAHCVRDIEGIALLKLAKLYERIDEQDQAASAYAQYINDTESQGITDRDDQSQAYKYLANYYLKNDKIEEAYHFAQRCREFTDTREEAKCLLREIAGKRAMDEKVMETSCIED